MTLWFLLLNCVNKLLTKVIATTVPGTMVNEFWNFGNHITCTKQFVVRYVILEVRETTRKLGNFI